ncbi:MAG: DUF4386 domain-containing protein [Pseudonocardia sp.]
MDITSTSSRRPAQGGPPLAPVAAGFAALFVTGLVASSVVGGGTFPSPFSDPVLIQAYFAGEPTAVLIGAVFQFAAAVPLAIFAAAVHARLHQLGVRVAGATIALTGGLLASAFATLSALFQWVLSRPTTAGDPALVRALHDLAFLAGGPASVVAFGLLLAGIAVPALILGLLPRWLAIAGLVLAVLAELSTLALLAPAFGVSLPLARFGGMIWLIAAGALLPATRKAAQNVIGG